jgi:hypothetical protein
MKIREKYFRNANTCYHSHSREKQDVKTAKQYTPSKQIPFNTEKIHNVTSFLETLLLRHYSLPKQIGKIPCKG